MPQSPPPNKHIKPKQKALSNCQSVVCVVVAITLAVMITMPLWYYYHSDYQKMRDEFTALQQQNQQMLQKLARLAKQNQKQQHTIDTIVINYTNLYHQLFANQDKWRIARAQYLSYLAHYNLVEGNVKLTLSLLKSADHLIAPINSIAVNKARRVLANTMAKLMLIPAINISALYRQLSLLSERIKQLKPIATVATKPNEHDNWQTKNWQTALKNNLKKLGRLVTIEHHQSLSPLLTANQYLIINDYLRSLSAQAQWAVIHRQHFIYQASLSTLSKMISTYYINSPLRSSLLSDIKRLKHVNLAPHLPVITKLVAVMRALPSPIENFNHHADKVVQGKQC